MIYHRVNITCTYSAVKEAQAKLEIVRSMLQTALLQAQAGPDYDNRVVGLHQIESKIAQAQGILDAVEGWLAPVKEGDDL